MALENRSIPYIYILYYQSNLPIYLSPKPASYPYKRNILFVMEVLEQPGRETCVHNILVISENHHANVDKQRKLLDDIDVAQHRAWSRSHDSSMPRNTSS